MACEHAKHHRLGEKVPPQESDSESLMNFKDMIELTPKKGRRAQKVGEERVGLFKSILGVRKSKEC